MRRKLVRCSDRGVDEERPLVVFGSCNSCSVQKIGHQVQRAKALSRAGSFSSISSSSWLLRGFQVQPDVDRQLIRLGEAIPKSLLDPVEGKGGFDARRLLKNEIPREFEMVP